MKLSKFCRRLKVGILASAAMFAASSASATIVQFETPLGNFEVNLYDQNTPITVGNFLTYVNAEDYDNTFIHRSIPGFVVQGGGFIYNNAWPADIISTFPPITNEPVYSNVRGTIAMAKLGGDPNSATAQWFINLSDNSANLDVQNGGFTVFGEVMGDGMAIVDQIAALPRYNLGGALAEIPLQNYDGVSDPDETNLALVTRIRVIDAATDTAANLTPPTNDLLVTPPTSSSGGGSLGISLLALLGLIGLRRRS
ncbi:peptidylprolyl isomerase [Aliikangiella marina]|uniref:Peptidyl-prolyl cis-trans isomerase n=1 Tax=Aliikangiella marina TaxID=1712262 RepID=A0A545TIA7_9GAMM|nr:peptidylprolyl isomerase [Aliikangiella marina]TQV76962.1 peptidylprolyl isomerase [Aliikangiella marina]